MLSEKDKIDMFFDLIDSSFENGFITSKVNDEPFLEYKEKYFANKKSDIVRRSFVRYVNMLQRLGILSSPKRKAYSIGEAKSFYSLWEWVENITPDEAKSTVEKEFESKYKCNGDRPEFVGFDESGFFV